MSYRADWTPSRWWYLYIGIGGYIFYVPFVGFISALGAAAGLVIYCTLIALAAWFFHKQRRQSFTTSDWRRAFVGAAAFFAAAVAVAVTWLGIVKLISLVQ